MLPFVLLFFNLTRTHQSGMKGFAWPQVGPFCSVFSIPPTLEGRVFPEALTGPTSAEEMPCLVPDFLCPWLPNPQNEPFPRPFQPLCRSTCRTWGVLGGGVAPPAPWHPRGSPGLREEERDGGLLPCSPFRAPPARLVPESCCSTWRPPPLARPALEGWGRRGGGASNCKAGVARTRKGG